MDRAWLEETLRAARAQGVRWVVGFDEAGRGALAGPVVVGAWVWRIEEELAALEGAVLDSKQYAPQAREERFAALRRDGRGVGAVGFASAREIARDGMAVALARARGGSTRGVVRRRLGFATVASPLTYAYPW